MHPVYHKFHNLRLMTSTGWDLFYTRTELRQVHETADVILCWDVPCGAYVWCNLSGTSGDRLTRQPMPLISSVKYRLLHTKALRSRYVENSHFLH